MEASQIPTIIYLSVTLPGSSTPFSATETAATAGVWTKTGGKYQEPAHKMLWNLPVSVACCETHRFLMKKTLVKWFNCWTFYFISLFYFQIYIQNKGQQNDLFFQAKMICYLLGIPTVAPPTLHPLPRPDVTPPPSGTSLLYAQGQQIGVLPLNGTQMDKQRSSVLLALHVRIAHYWLKYWSLQLWE